MEAGDLARGSEEGFADVSRLLAPRSVAVIGASDQPGNIGGAAVRFFRKFGSPCAVYPVNRGRRSVAGLPSYASVAELPTPTDLAILAVPAAAVAGVMRECAAAGIPAGIVWAGGFVEGGAAGLARQEELAAICRQTGFAMLGPNCIGVIDAHRAGHRQLRLDAAGLRPVAARQYLDGQPERRPGDHRPGAGAATGLRLSLHGQHRQRGGARRGGLHAGRSSTTRAPR